MLGAGVLGAGVLGAGVLGAGVLGAGVFGAGEGVVSGAGVSSVQSHLTVHSAFAPPHSTVITAVPGATAVIVPSPDTAATALSPEL